MKANNDFPKPIISIIEALDSSVRRRILIELESEPQTHKNLLDSQNLLNDNLNNHLKKLISSGMIRCFITKDNYNYVKYEISDLGRNAIEGLFSAFKPMRGVGS